MIRHVAESSVTGFRLSVSLRALVWRIYDIVFVTGCDGEGRSWGGDGEGSSQQFFTFSLNGK